MRRAACLGDKFKPQAARQMAKEQNADLRDFDLHNLSEFQPHHLVYVDESGCEKLVAVRVVQRIINITHAAAIYNSGYMTCFLRPPPYSINPFFNVQLGIARAE